MSAGERCQAGFRSRDGRSRAKVTDLMRSSNASSPVILLWLLAASCSGDPAGGDGASAGAAGTAGPAGGAPTTGGGTSAVGGGGAPPVAGSPGAGSLGAGASAGGSSANGGAPAAGASGSPAQSGSGGSPSSGGSGGAAGGNQAGSVGMAGSSGAASGGNGGRASGGNGGRAGGGSAGAAGSGGGGSSVRAFKQCRFHFGTIDGRAKGNSALIQQLDYFTPGWLGQADTFNMQSVCTQANGEFSNVVPAVVAYVIAFKARRDRGLEDCNVSGATNLCRYGATFIRENRAAILNVYRSYAQGFAGCYGTTKPMIWFMEPDFYQYVVGGDAQALTAAEAGQLMTEMVTTVRQALPNAVFSMDISPWVGSNGRENGSAWFGNFNMGLFTFINTSGGGTHANNVRIRPENEMTWAGVHSVTGKPILADTGYGVAGTSTGHDAQWDSVANINARIADGVVGISQYNPNSGWAGTIGQIRPQLSMVQCY